MFISLFFYYYIVIQDVGIGGPGIQQLPALSLQLFCKSKLVPKLKVCKKKSLYSKIDHLYKILKKINHTLERN